MVPPDGRASTGRPERIAFAIAAALLVALSIDALWAAPFIPATDMPGHLYGAVARAHIDEPARDHARFLVDNRPVTANGLIDVFATLEPLLGWRDAYRVIATLLVAAWLFGAGALVLAVDRRRAWLALLAASTAFGWCFYAGFFAFAFATALGFALLAAVLSPSFSMATPPRMRVLLALLLLVISLTHFFAAFLTGVAWLAIVVARAPSTSRAREALWVIACGVPAALVVLAAAARGVDAHDGLVEVLPFSLRVASFGEATIGGPLWRQAPLLVVMAASLVALLARWRARTAIDRALVCVAAAFLVVPLVVPWSTLGWQHLSPRPLPLAAVLLCAALPLERARPALRVAVAAACVVAACASTWWARQLHVRASTDLADVLRAVDRPVPIPAGYRWPFVLVQPAFVDDASLFRWDPVRGVGNLFGITQGGFVAHAFVNSPASDAVLLRPEARTGLAPPLFRSRFVTPVRALTGAARRARIDVLASHAVQTDGVIVVEEPADHALWRERGYVVDVEDGRVLLARFEGCVLDVKGADRAIESRIAPRAPDALARTDDVRGDARLERLPCGLLEVTGCGDVRNVKLQRGVVEELTCSANDAAPPD